MAPEARKSIVDFTEANILNMVLAFYKMGDVLYAPTDELVRMLAEQAEKPVFLMMRGIDTERFHLRGGLLTTIC
jgi:phosphatidylinositol alpha 1,6-mannosyltransferase